MDTQKDEISELFASQKVLKARYGKLLREDSLSLAPLWVFVYTNDVFIIWTVDYDVRRSSLKRRKW